MLFGALSPLESISLPTMKTGDPIPWPYKLKIKNVRHRLCVCGGGRRPARGGSAVWEDQFEFGQPAYTSLEEERDPIDHRTLRNSVFTPPDYQPPPGCSFLLQMPSPSTQTGLAFKATGSIRSNSPHSKSQELQKPRSSSWSWMHSHNNKTERLSVVVNPPCVSPSASATN